MESWTHCLGGCIFFLFQRKLYIISSISFLIFWNSTNLAYVSQFGNKDLGRYCTFELSPFCYWWLMMKKRSLTLYIVALTLNLRGVWNCNTAGFSFWLYFYLWKRFSLCSKFEFTKNRLTKSNFKYFNGNCD